MSERNMLISLLAITLVAVVVSGCGGPTLRAQEVPTDGSGIPPEQYVRFMDENGGHMVTVHALIRPQWPSNAFTEIDMQVAHKEGTTLESLHVEFAPGPFTPVYLEPPNHWLDGMEFLWQDGIATLRVPKLDDVRARSTVVYKFLVPSEALNNQGHGMPLIVRFVLDGTEAVEQFQLKSEAEGVFLGGPGEAGE